MCNNLVSSSCTKHHNKMALYSSFLSRDLKEGLTASASDGSYQTLMYGCCRASSTEILLEASITSIFDNKSLAWLAEKKKILFRLLPYIEHITQVFQTFKGKGQSNQVPVKYLCTPHIIWGLGEWSIWWKKKPEENDTVGKGSDMFHYTFSAYCVPWCDILMWNSSGGSAALSGIAAGKHLLPHSVTCF